MKQFRDKRDGSSLHVFNKDGLWLVKFTRKREWLRGAPVIAGPFKTEGDALLALAMDPKIGFNNFQEVRI